MFTRANDAIAKQAVVVADDLAEALAMLVEVLDCPRPVLLRKHEKEWDDYGRTTFRPGDFIEPVEFDRLELDAMRTPTKSRDPRNATGPYGQ